MQSENLFNQSKRPYRLLYYIKSEPKSKPEPESELKSESKSESNLKSESSVNS